MCCIIQTASQADVWGMDSFTATSCGNKVSSAGNNGDFKYIVDEFADIQILRYRVPEWDSLTFNQKAYIYHLGEAAKSGRDILFDQNCSYNLAVRRVLEKILEEYKGDTSAKEYQDFLIYAKRVFFSNGIHHHYALDKIIPECPQEYFRSLMTATGQQELCDELLPVIFDPAILSQRSYQGKDKDIVMASAVNFYDGNITKDEANAFYQAMAKPGDTTPPSYGLNSKLVKRDGKIEEGVVVGVVGHVDGSQVHGHGDVQFVAILPRTVYLDISVGNFHLLGLAVDCEREFVGVHPFRHTDVERKPRFSFF